MKKKSMVQVNAQLRGQYVLVPVMVSILYALEFDLYNGPICKYCPWYILWKKICIYFIVLKPWWKCGIEGVDPHYNTRKYFLKS